MASVEIGRFVFATCQVGAERALKRELGRVHPELRFAFSRPGFATFKLDAERPPLRPDFALRSVFARSCGLSLGPLGPRDSSDDDRARLLLLELCRSDATASPRLALHLWERDRWAPGQEPPRADVGSWAARALDAIRSRAAEVEDLTLDVNVPAQPGQLVHDLVLVDPDAWWHGLHRHGPQHSPFPGGRPAIALPDDAPSRAYLKLEEGLLWCGAALRPGDAAVEIGSAPGGASLALLRRGLTVVGIDPGAMHPRVLDDARFTHLACGVDAVRWEDLPNPVHWLLVDMNVQPRHALRALRQLLPGLQGGLLGVLATLKLNQWALADQLPGLLQQLRDQGLQRVGARQLASNHQEVFAYGLTAAGLQRSTSTAPERAP